MEGHTHTSASLREILAKDDSEALGSALDQGLDPKTWLDADSRDALLAVAVLEESPRCVELLLESGGDWTTEAPFDEDQESPLGLAAEFGSEIERYLADMPVQAHLDPSWVRVARWSRRPCMPP